MFERGAVGRIAGLSRERQTHVSHRSGAQVAHTSGVVTLPFGEDAYPTLSLKAAALLDSLARNHALVDGNKRIAWLAAVVFLDLNGSASGVSDDAAFDLVMDVAEGVADVPEIADRLRVGER